MKTMITNYAKSLDERIPDLTFDMVVDKTIRIEKGMKSTVTGVGIAALSVGLTTMDVLELSASALKTGAKAVGKAVKSEYENSDPIIVRR